MIKGTELVSGSVAYGSRFLLITPHGFFGNYNRGFSIFSFNVDLMRRFFTNRAIREVLENLQIRSTLKEKIEKPLL